jgi:hypothetical protein
MKTISTKALNVFSKTLIFSALAFCLVNTAKSQVCSSPSTVIYSLSNAGGIYPITVSNGNVGSIVNSTSYGSSTSANGIGYNTNNGLFYYFQVAISGAKTFVSYNPATNTYKTLASSSISATINRGCVNFNGTGYYGLDNNGNLYYYDISGDSWTLICSSFKDQFGNTVSSVFSTENSGDIAIDGYGNLWICASNGSKWALYELPAPLPTTNVLSLTVQQIVALTSTPAGLGFVGIAFDPTGNIYMGTTTDLYELQNTTTLVHMGTFSQTGICGDLTSCSYPYAILPVSWENFSVTSQSNKSVSVSWEVSEQINNSGYYVEHSTDGANWDKLDFITNKNSNEQTIAYNFNDNNPSAGKNYYRVCQVDIDGKESYSEIKSVNIDNNGVLNTITLWPNPARDAVKIQNNISGAIARIYSQSGSVVSEVRLQSGTNTINISNLSFGAYIVNIKDANGKSYNQKFIKE